MLFKTYYTCSRLPFKYIQSLGKTGGWESDVIQFPRRGWGKKTVERSSISSTSINSPCLAQAEDSNKKQGTNETSPYILKKFSHKYVKSTNKLTKKHEASTSTTQIDVKCIKRKDLVSIEMCPVQQNDDCS